MRKALLLIACFLCFAFGSFSTLAVMQWTQRITNSATVKAVGVGIYKDVNFTISVAEIDWGIIEPSESKNFSAYIVNESNVPITLAMTTESWSPLNASNFISLTWSYDGAEIEVDSYVSVTFFLQVDEAISGIETFSFTIVIVGTG